MFLTSSGKENIDYLVISGGTASVEGIKELLTEELGVFTIVANPFEHMEKGKNIDQEQLDKIAPQFMVAAGLALRSFAPWHI
jgi:type IV pilus assembly protein PilM